MAYSWALFWRTLEVRGLAWESAEGITLMGQVLTDSGGEEVGTVSGKTKVQWENLNEEEEGMKEVGMETKYGKGENGASKVFFFLLSSFNCWFTLINLEIVFCKEAILESQICLEASRYQLKRVSHLFCFILQLQSSNLVLREASLRRSKIPIMAVGVLNCFWLSWSN